MTIITSYHYRCFLRGGVRAHNDGDGDDDDVSVVFFKDKFRFPAFLVFSVRGAAHGCCSAVDFPICTVIYVCVFFAMWFPHGNPVNARGADRRRCAALRLEQNFPERERARACGGSRSLLAAKHSAGVSK